MSEGHSIHRLHAFVPHLAECQPRLLELLPYEQRPEPGEALGDWVWTLSQTSLMEICSAWVIESLRLLRQRSPLTNVLMRGCLHLPGEFQLGDASALAIGEVPPHGDPRREEIRVALARAVSAGILIHLPEADRYCIPYPVRLSVDRAPFLDALERDSIRLRLVQHYGRLAQRLHNEHAEPTPRDWRFSNFLSAYETAVDLVEEALGLEAVNWAREGVHVTDIPADLRRQLIRFIDYPGPALVKLQSGTAPRLLAASAAAARDAGLAPEEAQACELLGRHYLRARAHPDAIAAFRRAQYLREQQKDALRAVYASSAIGMALRDMGRDDLAIAEFMAAEKRASTANLHEQQIDTANCAADLLLANDRTFEAASFIDRVLDRLPMGERRIPSLAELLTHQGRALRLQGRHDQAEDRLFLALGTARHFQNRPAEARTLLELGRLEAARQNPQESTKWLQRARVLYLELSDSAGIGESLLAIATNLLDHGPAGDAETQVLRALRYARAANEPRLLADIWRLRQRQATRRGDHAGAISYLQQRLLALSQGRRVLPVVEGRLELAQLYLDRESHFAAGAEALRAQALARAYLDPADIPPGLEHLLEQISKGLSGAQFQHLVDEISDELESGLLIGTSPV